RTARTGSQDRVSESTRSGFDTGPLLGLRLVTERLELRLPDADEVVELAHLAEQGVHPPQEMPFFVPSTDRIRGPGCGEGFAESHGQQRESWSPAGWHLLLAVWAGGELIGSQGLDATDFVATRTAETGSWLGQRYQGRGFGTEMRAAMLELFFHGL